MNQILSVEMPKKKTESYRNKSSKKADTRTIIIFFSIILILLGAIFIVAGVLNKDKDKTKPNENPPVVTPPVIEPDPIPTQTGPKVEVEVDGTVLNIIVSHDKEISAISYNWNGIDGEEITNIGGNQKEIPLLIPIGDNTLNVTATDVNGDVGTFSNQYTGQPGPSLMLQKVANGVQLYAQSDANISTISYNWDGGEEKQIQINDTKTKQMIEGIEGEHTLNVVVVDVNGQEATKSQMIIGDTKPTLKITTDAAKTKLYIEASDDAQLKKLTVQDYNTGETKEHEITDSYFKIEVPLQQGDNKFIITVYNINDLEQQQKVRVVK